MDAEKIQGEGRVGSAGTGAPVYAHETFKWVLLVGLAWIAGYATAHIEPVPTKQVLTMRGVDGNMHLAHRYEFADPKTGEWRGEAIVMMKGGE